MGRILLNGGSSWGNYFHKNELTTEEEQLSRYQFSVEELFRRLSYEPHNYINDKEGWVAISGATKHFASIRKSTLDHITPYERNYSWSTGNSFRIYFRAFRLPSGSEILDENNIKQWCNHKAEAFRKPYHYPAINYLIKKNSTTSVETTLNTPIECFNSPVIIITLPEIKELLVEVAAKIKKQLKGIRRRLHHYITIDIRFLIRTIIRSLRITTFDGKDADSDFTLTNGVKVNHVNNLQNQMLWTKNRYSYNWYKTLSMS